MTENDIHFGKIAVRASVITGASQAIKVAIQFISVVALARLLEPKDFGLIAAVSPLIAFVGMFQDLGLQQAVVQRKDISNTQLNQIFWLMIWVGVACTILVMALSPAVSVFYNDDRFLLITIVAAIPIMIGGASSLHLSLLNRRLQFGHLALIDVAGAMIGLIAAIISACFGLGYWSLLIAPITTALISLSGAWLFSKWTPLRPQLGFERDILKFGANLTGYNILNFFARNLDNILIGKYAGSVELGYYDRAYKLMMFPMQNIVGPLTRVMVPLLSRIQDDKQKLRDMYLRTASIMSLAAVPGIAALTITSTETISFLFGEKWAPIAPIFAWLGIAGLIQPVNSTTGWLFIAQGRTGLMLKWGIFSSLTTIASFFIGLPWGAVGVAAAYAMSDIVIRLPILYFIMGKLGPISAKDLITIQFPLLGAAAMTLSIMLIVKSFDAISDFPLILLSVFISYSFAILALLCHKHGQETLREIWTFALSALHKLKKT